MEIKQELHIPAFFNVLFIVSIIIIPFFLSLVKFEFEANLKLSVNYVDNDCG